MNVRTLSLLAASAALAISATRASAVITYIDATSTLDSTLLNPTPNTTLADGITPFTPTTEATRLNSDNLWAERASTGNGGLGANAAIFESNGSTSNNALNATEDSPELKTVITGLTPGASYNLFTYFYDQKAVPGDEWVIQTGLTVGGLTTYTSANDYTGTVTPPGVSPTTFAIAPAAVSGTGTGQLDPSLSLLADGAANALLQVSLGVGVADSNGTVAIYVDDLAGGNNVPQNFRTRYDGVGYEAVPEPTSIALLGVAGGSLLLRRRRQA